MQMCMSCKYGHECPYMNTDDMIHVFLEGDEEIEKLKKDIDKIGQELEKKIKSVFEVSKEFSLDLTLVDCEGYENSEESLNGIDLNSNSDRLHALMLVLYGYADKCKSKVGVRVPFNVYEEILNQLQRYLNVLENGKAISKN